MAISTVGTVEDRVKSRDALGGGGLSWTDVEFVSGKGLVYITRPKQGLRLGSRRRGTNKAECGSDVDGMEAWNTVLRGSATAFASHSPLSDALPTPRRPAYRAPFGSARARLGASPAQPPRRSHFVVCACAPSRAVPSVLSACHFNTVLAA